jgi:transcription-repair coupling factor (superfamily II helicase)
MAYAYFTYRPGKALSEIATKRLAAIREFAEFGAGFKVALRDLEIRGAGNLLGAEQHGYIDSIGYDLYVRLLSEAVLEERGETKEAPYESTVDIAVSANIPERYIPVSSDRMQIYKKISLIREPIDMQDILDELIDRFGDAPRECLRLVRISLIRALASRSRMKRVEYKNSKLIFSVEKPELAVWSELFSKYKGLSFRGGGAFGVECRARSGDEAIELAAAILTDYTETASDIKKEEKKDEK